jgi:hypothetical protein
MPYCFVKGALDQAGEAAIPRIMEGPEIFEHFISIKARLCVTAPSVNGIALRTYSEVLYGMAERAIRDAIVSS